jgi:acetyl-CoA acetyltransferase
MKTERLLNDGETAIGGRIPTNTSGGLSSFGEAAPAQALAQICELVWQLRGAAGKRQVEGAKVGLSINFGLQGNASCVIVKR